MVNAPADEIIEDYASSLKELTFPARPIIVNLTMIAKENTDVADRILQQIKLRISRSIPDHKLAPLYLLDSICKNVGPPYNILIGDEIFELFSNVYLLVNDKTRTKLSDMFETWKMTKSKGSSTPVFPREQMDRIERFLRQARSSGNSNGGVIGGTSSVPLSAVSTAPSSVRTTPQLPSRPMVQPQYQSQSQTATGTMTNASLIKDIDSLIPIFQNKLRMFPSDSKIEERFKALSQLRDLLSSQTMQGEQLEVIHTHIQGIIQQESISPQLPSATLQQYNNSAEVIFQNLIGSGLIVIDQSPIPGSTPKYNLIFPRFKNGGNNNEHSNKIGASNALEQLLSSGIIDSSITGNNINGSTTTSNGNRNSNIGFDSVKHKELTKLNVDNNNLQKFINSNKPSSVTVSLLYTAKPSKCGTCGKRFSDNENGIQKRRLHLDWHFRVNKRLSSNISTTGSKGGIVQSRNWYLDDYDWVKFKDENLLEYSTSTNESEKGNQTNNNNDASTINGGEIPFVVIPTNETNMINKCQICQDKINATYDDDSGEWRWVNCIKAEGKNSRKIFHATCFNEANKKRTAEDDSREGVKREKL